MKTAVKSVRRQQETPVAPQESLSADADAPPPKPSKVLERHGYKPVLGAKAAPGNIRNPTLKRLSRFEAAERRTHVAKLRMQGVQVRQIAKILGIGINVVVRDMEVIAEENKKSISEFDKQRYIGDGLARYEELRQRAWSEYFEATEPRFKLKALDVLRSIQKDEFDALTQTGVIAPEPEQPQVVHTHTLKLDWSPEMRERVSQALLQQSLRTTLAEPLPELPVVMDATVVEPPTTGTVPEIVTDEPDKP
jgi:hypothetical protein